MLPGQSSKSSGLRLTGGLQVFAWAVNGGRGDDVFTVRQSLLSPGNIFFSSENLIE